LVVIRGEAIQLLLQVESVPEEGLVEIFAPKSSDESLDEPAGAADVLLSILVLFILPIGVEERVAEQQLSCGG
jgi:hypothetical protein